MQNQRTALKVAQLNCATVDIMQGQIAKIRSPIAQLELAEEQDNCHRQCSQASETSQQRSA